jgi:hypothetical protein
MKAVLFGIAIFIFGYITSEVINQDKSFSNNQSIAQISDIERYRILGEVVFEHAVIDIIMNNCMVDVEKVDDKISQGKVLCDKRKF